MEQAALFEPLVKKLPVISMWQPHASLMFAFLDGVRVKPDETRHWPFPARLRGKWVVIHAAQRRVTRDEADGDLGDLCAKLFGSSWAKSLPYGAYLGCVRFGEPLRMSEHGPLHTLDELCGYWTPSRWAWRTTDPRPLPEPISAKGQQGFWEINARLLTPPPHDPEARLAEGHEPTYRAFPERSTYVHAGFIRTGDPTGNWLVVQDSHDDQGRRVTRFVCQVLALAGHPAWAESNAAKIVAALGPPTYLNEEAAP